MNKGNLRQMDPQLDSRTVICMLSGYILLTANCPYIFTAEEDEREDILVSFIRSQEVEKMVA
jgi:hypothetical protein